MKSRTFVVIACTRKYNPQRKETYYHIEMLDDATGELVITYASEENYNFVNWQNVIDAVQNNSNQLPVLQGVFTFKRDKKSGEITNIVNADSRPRITETVDRETYLQAYNDRYLEDV